MKLQISPTCHICKNSFKSLMGLARHIPTAHSVTIESYYNRFIFPKVKDVANDNVCDFCGEKTTFISIVSGYHRFCSDLCASKWQHEQEKQELELKRKIREQEEKERTKNFKYKCYICKKKFETISGLSLHLTSVHKGISKREYYLKYVLPKTENRTDGHCLNCGNKTEFISVIKGFKKYCCLGCYYEYNNIQIGKKECKNKCFICGNTYSTIHGLSFHISRGHNISYKKYYKSFVLPHLNTKNKGHCLNCGNKTHFLGYNVGFLPFCCDECAIDYKINKGNFKRGFSLTCALCEDKFSSLRGLSLHIVANHSISLQEYYDYFIKTSDNEGVCPVCKSQTNFLNLKNGYNICCSRSCASTLLIENNKQYNLDKYGVEYYIQSKECRDKSSKSYFYKTGYTNPSYNPEVIKKREDNYFNKTGYTNPSYNPKAIEKRNKTNIERFEVPCVLSSPEVRARGIASYKEKTGYDNPSQNPEVKDKKAATLSEHYGVDIRTPLESKEVLWSMYKNNEDKYGTKFIGQLKEVREKRENTYRKNTGYKCPFANPEWREKIDQERFERTGYRNPSQNPAVHKKMFNFKNGSRSERLFKRKLKKHCVKFKQQYYLKNEFLGHHFDFAIFDNNNILNCLVEIDGELCHGLRTDCNGDRIRGDRDYLRWKLVPNKVKFLVIDSQRLKEGFKELQRILPMKYKDWNREMLRSIPKNIEEAIPKFSEKRMLYDWKRLCDLDYNKNAFLGKSILLNFCRSHWNALKEDWHTIRKTLYKSPCSEHHLLEGLDTFKNTSKLRKKYINKYKDDDFVVFKHHSVESMLAICSLGKTYVSMEPLDKESIKIVKFLNINVLELKRTKINDKK